jgi:hypothetical protein
MIWKSITHDSIHLSLIKIIYQIWQHLIAMQKRYWKRRKSMIKKVINPLLVLLGIPYPIINPGLPHPRRMIKFRLPNFKLKITNNWGNMMPHISQHCLRRWENLIAIIWKTHIPRLTKTAITSVSQISIPRTNKTA